MEQNDKYQIRQDGLFKDYDEALRVAHDMSKLIHEMLNLPTNIPGVAVGDVIDAGLRESIETISASVHFGSCASLRTEGIVDKNGELDASVLAEVLINNALGVGPDPLQEESVDINDLVKRQVREILNDKDI